MKTKMNKAVVVLMTAALLLTSLLSTGCISRKNKDTVELQSKIEEFIHQYASGDADALADLIDGRFYYQISSAKHSDILLKIASKTEVENYENIEIDRKAGKARIRTKISYIDIREFGRDKENKNLTKEQCIEKVDAYENRTTSNFSFVFVLDDEGEWKIKDTTAERYEDLFNHQYYLSVVALSKDQAKQECISVFDKLARGEFKQQMFTYNLEEMGAMNTWGRYETNIKDAMTEYAKAYFSFIVEHGITVEETKTPLQYKVTGYAPAKEALLSYYASDEYAVESSKATIRAELAKNDKLRQEVWDEYIAHIYYDMAKQIPNLMGEEFSIIFKVKASGEEIVIVADGPLFSINTNDIFACPKYEYAQGMAARKKAIQELFKDGELTRAQYDMYMSEFRDDGRDNAPQQTTVVDTSSGTVNWQGTKEFPNQAVNVKEVTPDWSDGDLIYGSSETDAAGIYMHYTKEPGWLNTAGYSVTSGGTVIMLKYDKKFTKGTKLAFDWTINGKEYQTNVVFTVDDTQAESGVFIFALPNEMKAGDIIELRLWEEGHRHVIAYVKLTKT